MKLFFRTLAIVMAALLAVYVVGCGGEEDPETPDAAFDSAIPADGELAANGSITVTFDEDPGKVTASVGDVTGKGKTRKITAPADDFPTGALALNLTWENGGDDGHTLNYTVVAADETAPTVTGSSPENGAKDVDAGLEMIEITFSEDVTGTLKLMDGDREDDVVEWDLSIKGKKATFTVKAGQELGNETEYMVTGTVMDGSNNKLEGTVDKPLISFVTKAKE